VDANPQIKANEREEPLTTLQQRYPIKYRRPLQVPVQLLITGNKLRIRFYIRYSKNMFDIFPGSNLTYADIAEDGIRENWSGLYYFPWLADDGYERAHAKANVRVLDNNESPSEDEITPQKPSIRTIVEFVRFSDNNSHAAEKQRFVSVGLTKGTFLPAHVTSPPWRWYWGFFRTFQLEACHLNWSRKYPGRVTLQKDSDRGAYSQICSHEVGHLLGIGDAYGANYRFFYEAPGTGNYMMCHNRKVQPEEIEMMFQSHMTNRMHYFPKKFKLKIFMTGVRRAYRLQFHSLTK
jgi:hypothetical protein